MLSTRQNGSPRLADRSRCEIVEGRVFVFRDGVKVKRQPATRSTHDPISENQSASYLRR